MEVLVIAELCLLTGSTQPIATRLGRYSVWADDIPLAIASLHRPTAKAFRHSVLGLRNTSGTAWRGSSSSPRGNQPQVIHDSECQGLPLVFQTPNLGLDLH